MEAVTLCARPGTNARQLIVMCCIIGLVVTLVPNGRGIGEAAIAGGIAAGLGVTVLMVIFELRARRPIPPGTLPPRFLLALTPDRLLVIRSSGSGRPREVLEEIPRWAFRIEEPERKFQTLRFVLATSDGRRRPAETPRSAAMAPNARAIEVIAAAGAPVSPGSP